VRSAAFVTGGLIPTSRRGSELNAYLHLADWLPTFCALAGVDPADKKAMAAGLPPIDGVDVMPQILGLNVSNAHDEIPLSSNALLDTVTGCVSFSLTLSLTSSLSFYVALSHFFDLFLALSPFLSCLHTPFIFYFFGSR
jgi:hypothetical protein